MNLDEAIRLLEDPINFLTNEELRDYLTQIPEVGRQLFVGMDDDKCIGMVNIISASVYAMLMTNGHTDVTAVTNELLQKICAVAMRATAGLLTMEEIR